MNLFDFCTSVQPQAQPCTREDFERIIKSDVVVGNCAKIREIIENTPADASDEQLKARKDAVNKWKAGSKEDGIKSLPGFTFHAHFTDGRRSNKSAVASGLVSIDLDDIEKPREFFEGLRQKAVALKAALCFITPSTRGLKFVMPIPEGAMTIEEAQEELVNELGVESYFDHSTIDLARLAFAVPEDYILYRNDDILFGENTVPKGFEKHETVTVTKEELAQELPENDADQHFIDGIRMSDIVGRLCIKFCGMPEPPEGKRNNTLYKVARGMRCFCDDDIEELMHIVPTFGLGKEEYITTVKHACARPVSDKLRAEMEMILSEMKREKAIENGSTIFNLPQPPKRLPPVFKEFASVTPQEILPAQMMTILSILGFYGSMVKANFAAPRDAEKWLTPSFIVVIIAPPASGKNVITATKKMLTHELKEQEKELLKQLNIYNKTKKDSDLPERPILLMPERLSMTSMSFQLELANGHHLFLFTPEIDTLKASNGSGSWSDLTTVFRKAIDNDEIGQIYMSGDSRSCTPDVYLNMLILAQPETFAQFFNKNTVINGLDTRAIPVELPDNTGCREVTMKRLSDFEMANIKKVIEQLKCVGKVVSPAEYDEDGNLIKPAVMERQIIDLPRSRNALEKWGRQKQNHYLQTQDNPAEDHYFRRAKQLGFHAAMVAYMCSGMMETKAVIDFALWVAEYILQSQMMLFGNTYNELHNKRVEKRVDNIIAITEHAKFNLFNELPETFTTADMQKISATHGKTMKNPSNKITPWRKAGFIIELPSDGNTKRWKKIGQPLSAC